MLRLAALSTVYRPLSHMDVLLHRWLERPPGDAAWGFAGHRTQIVSAYVQQFPENDIGRDRLASHGVPLYPGIREALTGGGGNELAVDGVLLIAEHGEYPNNEFEQKLYPRKDFFDQIVSVFDACGRSVPVFCDKHLSWDFGQARQMVEAAQQRGALAGQPEPAVDRRLGHDFDEVRASECERI
ncbi:MAG: hypothetical protein AAGL98_08725, partial [Planctomycetota bacterium]